MNRWHVRIDNQGNIDQRDLQNQLQRKADQKVSQFKTGCIISIVMAVLAVGIIAAVGIYIAYQVHKSGGVASVTGEGPATVGSPKVGTWDGKSTFECGGNDVTTLTGVTANVASGSAIEASGNCKLTLTNVNVTGDTVIKAGANAVVTIVGGSLSGKTAAIDASANAKVVVTGAKVTGKVEKSGLATVVGVN